MKRQISIGNEDFKDIIENNYLYVDKTDFISEWWNNADKVTLITRPRRFGKTLTLSMIETFFSIEYKDNKNIFKNLKVYFDEEIINLQGTYPVIRLSLNGTEADNYNTARENICGVIKKLYLNFRKEINNVLDENELELIKPIYSYMDDALASDAISILMLVLYRYYNKKVIVLIDEYDYPMQKAYECGYWEKLVGFLRNILTKTLKSNKYLERGLLTGITLVSKESIFSGLNNIEVNNILDKKYATSFGFTDMEVNSLLQEYNLYNKKQEVISYYNGFKFGNVDIYNPWSILKFLNKGEIGNYWINTSGNVLISNLLKYSSNKLKFNFEKLLNGDVVKTKLDLNIVYTDLTNSEISIYSLFVLSGYLKVIKVLSLEDSLYEIAITNIESLNQFKTLIQDWFKGDSLELYTTFIDALVDGNVELMNLCLSNLLLNLPSYLDMDFTESEKFYHVFILGLVSNLNNLYYIKSNRESGYGRYDLIMEPKTRDRNAIILEFKVCDSINSLEKSAKEAINQINRQKYDSDLMERGFNIINIKKYGLAFYKKNVKIISG